MTAPALQALAPYVPCALCALVHQLPRALRAHVHHVPHPLRGLVPHVPRVLRTLLPICFRTSNTLCPTCFHALNASWLKCFVSYVPHASSLLNLSCVVPYMLSCLDCLLSKHLLVLKTSWILLQDMSWRRFQHIFSVTIFHLPRRLEDVLQRRLENALEDEKLLCLRRLQDFLTTFLEDVLKRCLEDIFKTSWRQRKWEISESNKSKCVCISQIYTWRI